MVSGGERVEGAYIEVPRLRQGQLAIAMSGHMSDLLDLARLQPVHIDVDAIYRERRSAAWREMLHRFEQGKRDHDWEAHVPSLRFPEVPNSMFVVVEKERMVRTVGGGRSERRVGSRGNVANCWSCCQLLLEVEAEY